MEFMYWRKTGLLDHHGYERCVCEMIRVMFILTFVSSSKSVMMSTRQKVKLKSRLVSPMDLRTLHSILFIYGFAESCFCDVNEYK